MSDERGISVTSACKETLVVPCVLGEAHLGPCVFGVQRTRQPRCGHPKTDFYRDKRGRHRCRSCIQIANAKSIARRRAVANGR